MKSGRAIKTWINMPIWEFSIPDSKETDKWKWTGSKWSVITWHTPFKQEWKWSKQKSISKNWLTNRKKKASMISIGLSKHNKTSKSKDFTWFNAFSFDDWPKTHEN